ncbi:MAG: DNA translocase FtsK 4TM domain-containing protein [Bacteroidales bacterium]|jgi:S-DNA-T family DNA segregation ATPase FtsK/SpoIIIE
MVEKKNISKNTLKEKQAETKEIEDYVAEEPKQNKKNKFTFDNRFFRVTGLIFILLSVYFIIAFSSYIFTWSVDFDKVKGSWLNLVSDNNVKVDNWLGKFGAIISHIFIYNGFGVASYLFVLIFLTIGLKLFIQVAMFNLKKLLGLSFFLIIMISVILGHFFVKDEFLFIGGVFGYQSNLWLNGALGNIGTTFLLVFSVFIFFVVVFNSSFNWLKLIFSVKEKATLVENDETVENKELKNVLIKDVTEEDTRNESENKIEISTIDENGFENVELKNENEVPVKNEVTTDKTSDIELIVENPVQSNIETIEINTEPIALGEYDPTLDLPKYQPPTIELLEEYGTNAASVQKEELEANKNKIIETLGNYGIQIAKIKATIGPSVTLYEIIPEAGVRIAKIKNLEDDIALSLSALGIRIIAPIPGRGTIGIEVPNLNPEIVSMKSIFMSDKFQNSGFDLPIGLGKTIANEVYVADLTKMPHLLMAGATGQGKSVGLNAILASLLYKKHPSQVKFILIDPKKVELTLFSKIERHFLAKLPDFEEAIITDTRKVVRTLNSLCIVMESRYDLLKDAGVRNIKEYNKKFIERKLNPNEGHHFFPYLVVIIDEFADLIMTAGKEVELPLTRLAQLARAVGIHLIIATQRPSVNIITGTIKANFPARLAFRVISKIDSRTILDIGGADQLVGRGDMLLSTGSDLIRLQCAFIDTPEVNKITDFIGSQEGYTSAFLLPEFNDENSGEKDNYDSSERDPMFEEAARVIVMHQQGSTSLIQRKLKLGYNRAGRIIDQLEAAGIVGPFEGSKAREVRIKDEMSLEQFLRDVNKN